MTIALLPVVAIVILAAFPIAILWAYTQVTNAVAHTTNEGALSPYQSGYGHGIGDAKKALDPNSYQAGYQYGINDRNQHTFISKDHYECPLSHTAPHSNFCKGYDAALMYENSDI